MTSIKNSIHGWLTIDKPLNLTSAQVVAKVRKKFKNIKVGHAGTLDPLATGVLPLALGEATKSIQYIVSERKKYKFEVTWGESRTTDDSEGDVVHASYKYPTIDKILEILPSFQGKIAQIPPFYCALKIQGQRAYDLMRRQKEVNLPSRLIEVYALTHLSKISLKQSLFEIECSKGTYVRALARDMGEKLGCYGYASAIDRLKVGPFEKKQSLTLEMLASLDENVLLKEYVKKIQDVLDDIPAVFISEPHISDLKLGRSISESFDGNFKQNQLLLCLNAKDEAVAFVRLKDEKFYPERVFNIE